MLSNLIILYLGINIILTCIAYKIFKDKSVSIKRFTLCMALGGIFFALLLTVIGTGAYLISIIKKE